MKFTLYTADCTGNETNCLYPHKAVISSPAELARAVSHDHVAAAYRNDYRSNDNFISADAVVWDCDNDHTENPDEWVTPEKLAASVLADIASDSPCFGMHGQGDLRRTQERRHETVCLL